MAKNSHGKTLIMGFTVSVVVGGASLSLLQIILGPKHYNAEPPKPIESTPTKIETVSENLNCFPEWSKPLYEQQFTIRSKKEGNQELVFYILPSDEGGENFTPQILEANCDPYPFFVFQPWSDSIPERKAIELKTVFYRFLHKQDSKKFQEMITTPQKPQTGFYQEDVIALDHLGFKLGKSIQVFDSSEDYDSYLADNDPKYLKDYVEQIEKGESSNFDPSDPHFPDPPKTN